LRAGVYSDWPKELLEKYRAMQDLVAEFYQMLRCFEAAGFNVSNIKEIYDQEVRKAYIRANEEKTLEAYNQTIEVIKRVLDELRNSGSELSYRKHTTAILLKEAASILFNLSPISFNPITYESDGLRIHTFLARPLKEGMYPAIVHCHGGIDGLSSLEDLMVPINFAARGYVCLAANYRGEPGADGKLSDGEVEWAKGEVNDVLNGIEHLKKLDFVDKSKIGMIGHSHGAWISILACEKTTDVKALVAMCGSFSRISEMKEIPFVRPERIRSLEKELKDRDPIVNIDKITCPILLVAAGNDKKLPKSQVHEFAEILRKKGKEVNLKVYPNAQHGFVYSWKLDEKDIAGSEKDTEDLWNEIYQFFGNHLKRYS